MIRFTKEDMTVVVSGILVEGSTNTVSGGDNSSMMEGDFFVLEFRVVAMVNHKKLKSGQSNNCEVKY